MIQLVVSSEEDISNIQRWTDADPFHRGQDSPEWWLTGTGFLSFRLDDEQGPLVYVKIMEEGSSYRIHCQFAPVEEVSKRRLAVGMLKAFPVVMDYLSKQGAEAAVFNTISDSLRLSFMSQGFVPEDNCDYVLRFKES
jgi:hypothetical protein